MNDNLTTDLLANLCIVANQTTAKREEVRVWSMSGVERVTFPDGCTRIFKYAKRPFDSEDHALRLAGTLGIPAPKVYHSVRIEGWLGMLLEDLGTPVREADDLDGAAAAVVLHRTRTAGALPVLHEEGLRALPSRALDHLDRLRKADRWPDTGDIEQALDQIARAADARAQGTTLAPFGWVHSEFHPTSLHIGRRGWRLLDFARAFTGPGLLDLASWHGTLDDPDPVRLRVFWSPTSPKAAPRTYSPSGAACPRRSGRWAGTACGPSSGSWSSPSAGSTTPPPTPPTSRSSAGTSPTSSSSWRCRCSPKPPPGTPTPSSARPPARPNHSPHPPGWSGPHGQASDPAPRSTALTCAASAWSNLAADPATTQHASPPGTRPTSPASTWSACKSAGPAHITDG
ncbi:hypothetical protein SGPA1_12725 [Streptomyces misionensis JCM 4497]